MKDFSKLEQRLGIFFENKKILIEAFCHRSYLNEHPDFPYSHQERLEFLGDAILEAIVTEFLFKNFLQKGEGELTCWRAALVNSKMLAKVAKDLGFEEFLLLSKGEEKETGKARQKILANTFEAFLGALYLEKGIEFCKNFVEKNLLKYLPEVIEKGLFKDPKTMLQEQIQAKLKITPTYKVLREWGPEHAKHFEVGVFVGQKLIATGQGTSKQEAEEEAAKKALEIKNW